MSAMSLPAAFFVRSGILGTTPLPGLSGKKHASTRILQTLQELCGARGGLGATTFSGMEML
jgi:hypothetical protein